MLLYLSTVVVQSTGQKDRVDSYFVVLLLLLLHVIWRMEANVNRTWSHISPTRQKKRNLSTGK